MALAQVEFMAEGVRHKVELDRQASGYVVRIDGESHSLIPAAGFGFRRRFALLDGTCTISGIDLGWFYKWYKIEIKQPTQTVAV